MGGRQSYEVVVEEVHSGDDLVLMVNLGIDGLFKKVRARLYGVDTPNAYREKADTDAGSVRDEVRKLTKDSKCSVQVISQGKGGWIVTLFVQNAGASQINLNELLISRGYVYQGNKSAEPQGAEA